MMKLTKKAAKALEKSIIHWKENRDAKGLLDTSISSDDCALCDAFLNLEGAGEMCERCPIAKQTGVEQCSNTPYGKAANAAARWERNDRKPNNWKRVCQAEVDFLKGLRNE